MSTVTSKAFGLISSKGIDKQKIDKIEGMVAEDMQEGLLNAFPEFELVLGWLSPETLEALKENPATLPILFQRYGPMIPGLLKSIPGLRDRVGGRTSGQFDAWSKALYVRKP